MKKMIGRMSLCLALAMLLLTGCTAGGKTLARLDTARVDSLRVVTAMGNPAYGADSKRIADPEELAAFVALFNSGVVGDEVPQGELGVAMASRYTFFSGDEVLAEFFFNGNDTGKVWRDEGFHYVEYGQGQPSPLALYEASAAQTVVLDENLQEMERPAE